MDYYLCDYKEMAVKILKDEDIIRFKEWYNRLQDEDDYGGNQFGKLVSRRSNWLLNNPCPVQEKIVQLYRDGYGYKTLGSSENLNLSYSLMRKLLIDYWHVDVRTGYKAITSKLKEQRVVNATGNKSNWFDWTNRKPWMQEKTTRSIQGYYRKKSGEYVWLRSTYEYIYAKWLDGRNIDWKIEVQSFKLKNNENYRPDFFIYKNNVLEAIVEIKSNYYIEEKTYKYNMFKEEYPHINSSIIFNIDIFSKLGYHKEIKEWKAKRLSKVELEKLA